MIIDIIIDKITDCLEDRRTGETVPTTIKTESITQKEAHALKKAGWKFNWASKDLEDYEISKLFVKGVDGVQGIVAFKELYAPNTFYVEVGLVEAAPHNVGKNKRYIGVGPHLFAIACKRSFDCGFDGFVSFTAKSNLIAHYENSVYAHQVGSSQIMHIYPNGAKKLVDFYFKGGDKNDNRQSNLEKEV